MLACECLSGLSQKPSPQLADVLAQMVFSDYHDIWWSCWYLIVVTVIRHL